MLAKISKAIDTINTKQGDLTSLLILPLAIVVFYEVIMRYVFNAPTIWGFEATIFLYGLHFMFGYSYTEVLEGNVKVDIFTSRMSEKTRAILNIITHCVFFLPVFSCLTYYVFQYALTSTMQHEVNSTSWAPPIWPFKLIMAFCFFLLLMQGVSNVLKSILVLTGRTDQTAKG
ncbi:MAG: TRAP transporter small permease subunit [Desulfobacterales bacterium]|jgi:TRAP-type mannitol/chloroaromatic compound transport system permease small subunit